MEMASLLFSIISKNSFFASVKEPRLLPVKKSTGKLVSQYGERNMRRTCPFKINQAFYMPLTVDKYVILMQVWKLVKEWPLAQFAVSKMREKRLHNG